MGEITAGCFAVLGLSCGFGRLLPTEAPVVRLTSSMALVTNFSTLMRMVRPSGFEPLAFCFGGKDPIGNNASNTLVIGGFHSHRSSFMTVAVNHAGDEPAAPGVRRTDSVRPASVVLRSMMIVGPEGESPTGVGGHSMTAHCRKSLRQLT